MATREELARQYDSLLIEYDKKARQVSVLEAEFDMTNEQKQEVKTVKSEMNALMRRAEGLVGGNI